ncbi:MAG: CDP-glycerol glycerophosphotransferase family protein [Microbacterium sp.]
MASFSFGAGNAGKLLRIPLYLAGRAATVFIPRTRELWVFGCAVGLTDGAWALWEHASAQGERAVWLTGSERDEAEARRRGILWARKDSWRGFWLTARAAVIVATHGFGDVNRYAATGGVIVQLWHGIPLKRIGLDAAVTTRSPLPFATAALRVPIERALAQMYRRTQARIRILPAASELVRGRLESAFALPAARVPVTGEPRVDVLSQGEADERRARARARLVTLTGTSAPQTRFVLYAPTWRDGDVDPAVPTRAQARALATMLDETDAVLLIRPHPLGAGAYTDIATAHPHRIRMLGSDIVADVTPLLPGMDVLVTDYSSLLYDAALVPVPVVCLAPDLSEYTRARGFYGTYAEVGGADAATDWEGTVARVRRLLSDDAAHAVLSERMRELSARVHAFDDGDNTVRVYRAIRTALAAEGGS